MSTLASWWFNKIFGAEDDGDLASIPINEYNGDEFPNLGNPIGRRVVIIDSGQQAYKINHGSITAGTSASIELENTNVDYQTTGTAKVILIIRGSNTTVTDFEIIEDATTGAGTGTTKEDFPSVSIGSAKHITSKELSFAASKFITVKCTTGLISGVSGFVIE